MEVGRASSSPADLLAFMMVARLTDLTSTTELARTRSSRAGRIAFTAWPDLEEPAVESVILMETLERAWAVLPAATLTLSLMSSITLRHYHKYWS